jgi:uncharacterized protein YegP (UPF0339 family)
MSMGRFLISRDATGAFHWVLRDAAGATVTESAEGYTEHKACIASLANLRKLAANAEVIDLTMPAKVIKPKGIARAKAKPVAKSTKKKGKR